MPIYYGESEKSNIKSRLNGVYMGTPNVTTDYGDWNMPAKAWVSGFTNPHTAIIADKTYPNGSGIPRLSLEFKYVGKFRTGTNITTKQGIFGQYGRPTDFLLPVLGIRNSKFEIFLSSEGTSWDIAANVQPDYTLEANTTYAFEFHCTYASGNYTYKLYANKNTVSTLGTSQLRWSFTSTKNQYNNAYYDHTAYISWGNNQWGVNQQAPFLGQILISECKLYGDYYNLTWRGLLPEPKVKQIAYDGKNIKSVVAVGRGVYTCFGPLQYLNYACSFSFSTPTDTHSVRVPFDITKPDAVKVSDYPVSIPAFENFSLNYYVGSVDANGKPTSIYQGSTYYDLNTEATNLANSKCFGTINGVNTTGIYLGYVKRGDTVPNMGIACKGALRVGNPVSTFSLYTGNDKVARIQLKEDGCLYYSASVYNQSLVTKINSVTDRESTRDWYLTKQFIG